MGQHRLLLPTIVASCLLVIVLTCGKYQLQPASPEVYSKIASARPAPEAMEGRSLLTSSQEEEEQLVARIRQKLRPVDLIVDENNALEPHQFLHLHHMKTGGTSIDHLLKCARERLGAQGYDVDHYSIHECARGKFRKCVENSKDPCRDSMDHAATMSFCSALKHLNRFGWDDINRIKSFTVLRHPVERVWSMYRFETKMCYSCMNLTDVYDLIDNNDILGWDSLCLAQLQNHETANLLTSDWPEDASDDEIVAEAIENMKNFFTLIGLTEELTLSTQMLGTVFPWINKTIEGSHMRCGLPHANSSPENNHCIRVERTDGKKGFLTEHWPLPDHPDEKTRKAIEEHNKLDLKLYEA
eukprot:CAMPEP_0176138680 /NCGR_PEP_ID=MMETSP0120_2-20121206/70448_1 /TAXON_ID=160619 /ORGANISM="Kryptoperidinium foliaceum, Strain CCMP 1326" /LENGTH=355 /DNA_ID=CAMNT_0017474629 /DNA_START=71 /DNA_END=1134 /DNA_ORIENTATION=-